MTEEVLSGLVFVDMNRDVLLIQPTKKISSQHKLYIHNLSKNRFVSTLFVKKVNNNLIVFDYNDFDLEGKRQIFYRVNYDVENNNFEIHRVRRKKISDVFVNMEFIKRKEQCKRIRKYIEV